MGGKLLEIRLGGWFSSAGKKGGLDWGEGGSVGRFSGHHHHHAPPPSSRTMCEPYICGPTTIMAPTSRTMCEPYVDDCFPASRKCLLLLRTTSKNCSLINRGWMDRVMNHDHWIHHGSGCPIERYHLMNTFWQIITTSRIECAWKPHLRHVAYPT